MPIKILFIDAKDTSNTIETRLPPLGIGYLVSSIRKRFGPEVAEFRIISDGVEAVLDSFKPALVGISSVSQNYGRAISSAAAAKKHGVPVICGGVHISMLPQSLDANMDLGVIGEGEETFCDLFDLFQKTGSLSKKSLPNISGIVFRGDDGALVFTAPRGVITPLDNIPFPARDLVLPGKDAHIFTSRGCPFKCVFCASSRFWNKVRLFSAEYVAEEIEFLVTQYGAENISFQDDLFTCDVERLRRVKMILARRGILGKVRFSGAIRAELVNDTTIALLKELNVVSLGLGLESGNDRHLKYLKGPSASLAHNEKAVSIIKKHGIAVVGSFVIGAPQEGREEILDTLRFIKRTGVEHFNLYVLTPFPGTPIWEYAKEKGFVSDNMNWEILNVNLKDNMSSVIILSEKLSREEVLALYARFTHYVERKHYYSLLKKGLAAPWKIPMYFLKRMLAWFY